MSASDRFRLTARIRQIRRSLPNPPPDQAPDPERVDALETRVSHLEAMLQGLQDSVDREFQRQDKHHQQLDARLDPAALTAALSKHAREHGL
jgi:uncharacterized coiled-coil protein SlyX